MNEVQRILEQYDQTMDGVAWYGDPVWTILEGIDARCAAALPLAGVHTIWQLVMHMRFWEDVAMRRLSGPVIPDEAGNFPDTPAANEEAWQRTLEEFRHSNREFRDALSRLDPSRLDQLIPGEKRTCRNEAVGVIQHHIYHAGQIALLKKAYLGGNRKP